MTAILPGRFTAKFDQSLAVFIIGMRINHFRKIGKWLPVARAMRPMIRELAANPQSGFLGVETMLRGPRTLLMLQYWRDFDSLEAYARDRDQQHWPAWVSFNQAVGSDGTVGIFHETFVVPAGCYETVYGNMPPFGLGKVGGVVPATGKRNEARSRMKAAVEG